MYVTKIREEMIKSNEDLVNSDDDNIYYLINQKRQSLPAIFPKKFYIRPCCQPRKMPTVHLERFKIKLEEKDACFAPGDVIAGNVQIIASTLFNITKNTIFKFQKCSHSANENDDALHIKKLKMNVLGIIKIKEENKLMFNETFLRMEADLLVNKGDNNTTTVRAGDVKTIKFEIRLPQKGLFTSLESKSVSVLYTVQLELIYKNNKSEEELNAKTICGFTVVDCFDLARMPKFYFQPCSQNVVKKFGLFSCTGGQIRLNFSINGVAFVGGENIIIEGKIDNRTDRRIDKLTAHLQQIVSINGQNINLKSDKIDLNEIHDDNLALFMDPGAITVALDGTDPETCYAAATTNEGNKLLANRKTSIEFINKCKRRNSAQQQTTNEKLTKNKNWLINISYQLCFSVTTDGLL
ncbi:Arrestin_C domain-containing protein [Meloidogyne graminicola]|uniref:Arrestin_C domain-containing protein n=1 Tax=Meloidogyne graminicola TaxID=189291 RepID=A0A8S9Z9P3_9BILA|nr:Arrestin_C domain-containing protein [Meloidogyne graminicola]